MHTGVWWGDLWERDNLEDRGADGGILKWTFKMWEGEIWTGLIWLRVETGGPLCGNEPLGSIKCGDRLD